MSGYVLRTKAYYKALSEEDGASRVFDYAWRKYNTYLKGSIDYPACDLDVLDWLDSIITEVVNDPDSPYYIFG